MHKSKEPTQCPVFSALECKHAEYKLSHTAMQQPHYGDKNFLKTLDLNWGSYKTKGNRESY